MLNLHTPLNFIQTNRLILFRYSSWLLYLCLNFHTLPAARGEDNYGSSAQSKAKSYIERFRDLAINEMLQNNIPASIKLAQGMFESQNGESKLARKANNHFGIKCNTDWQGDTILHDDDAPSECFRKYESPEDSYIDHSYFILNRARYDRLFALAPNDYIAWAKGLKEAGYATLPEYADRIIKLIEEYKLYEYDRANSLTMPPVVEGNSIILSPNDEKSGVIYADNARRMDIGESASFVANARGSLKANMNRGKTDLRAMDEIITACESCRPADVVRQMLDGQPAVYPQPEDIAPTLKRSPASRRQQKHNGNNTANYEKNNPEIVQANKRVVYDYTKPETIKANPQTIQQARNETNTATLLHDSYPYPTPKHLLPDYATNEAIKPEPTPQQLPDAIDNRPQQPTGDILLVSNRPPKMKPQEMAAAFRKETNILPPQNLHYVNEVKSVVYPYDVRPEQIAATYKLAIELVLRYNDLANENSTLPMRVPIFLQPKKDKSDEVKQHPVKKGETPWAIAQRYAIGLTELCKINNISPNEPLSEGRKIKLK